MMMMMMMMMTYDGPPAQVGWSRIANDRVSGQVGGRWYRWSIYTHRCCVLWYVNMENQKSYYQSGLDWWQSLLPVRKCLGILRLQAAHAHCSQYMCIVDNMAAAHV